MGKYVRHARKSGHDIDKLIDEKLKLIVGLVSREIPGLKAFMLTGGFGRGEGAVEIHKGNPRLVNDFDFYAITERQQSDDFLEDLALRCSKMIGKGGLAHPEGFERRYDFEEFFHIDIHNIPEKKLPGLPPTVRYFEIRNSSTVLYGDKDMPKKFPDISPRDIPLPEALRLIMNRMMLLVMSFSTDFLKKSGYMSEDERGIMSYYIAKSYLTAAEALLILSGKFRASYAERAEVFAKVYGEEFPELRRKIPDLAKKVKFFTDYKMLPQPGKVDPMKEWFECREALGQVFRLCLGRFLGREMPSDWARAADVLKKELPARYFDPYARHYLRRMGLDNPVFRAIAVTGAQLFMNMKYMKKLGADIKRRHWSAFSFMDHGVRILYTTPLILYSVGKDGSADQRLIRRAYAELARSYPGNETEVWDEIKSHYLKAYRLYYLQKFI